MGLPHFPLPPVASSPPLAPPYPLYCPISTLFACFTTYRSTIEREIDIPSPTTTILYPHRSQHHVRPSPAPPHICNPPRRHEATICNARLCPFLHTTDSQRSLGLELGGWRVKPSFNLVGPFASS